MADEKTLFHEEILLLAEKLGELTERLERIEAENTAQTAPLDAAKGAQESALKALESALAGIRALNFHVLDNNLGAVSARLAELEKQADTALKALEAKIETTANAVSVVASGSAQRFESQESQRIELEQKRAADVQTFEQRVETVRSDIAHLQNTLLERIEAARKEFATPATLNPTGKYQPNRLYKRLDLVELNGSSFVSTEDDNDEKPGTKAKKWQTIARRGAVAGFGGTGEVVGPASATDNAIPLFNGATGKIIKNSVLIANPSTGALSGFATGAGLTFHGGGTINGTDGSVDITASGTNKDIILQSSGTGDVEAHTLNFKTVLDEQYASLGTLHMLPKATAPSSSNWALAVESGATTYLNAASIITFTIGGAAKWQVLNVGTLAGYRTSLGTTSTDGLTLINQTAAAAGAQQISPRILVQGKGWKTDATAASQTVDAFFEVLPVQGTSAPTGLIRIGSIINGGAATYPLTLTSAGSLTVQGARLDVPNGSLYVGNGTVSVPTIAAAADSGTTGLFFATGRVAIANAGALAMDVSGGNNAIVKLGGTTSSFPAIKRNSAAINFRLADDSADAAITCAAITASGAITTSAPASGAGAWELGTLITSGTSALSTTSYVEIEIGGSLVKLGVVTNS